MRCVLLLEKLRGKQVRDLHGPATVFEEFSIEAWASHWDKSLGREWKMRIHKSGDLHRTFLLLPTGLFGILMEGKVYCSEYGLWLDWHGSFFVCVEAWEMKDLIRSSDAEQGMVTVFCGLSAWNTHIQTGSDLYMLRHKKHNQVWNWNLRTAAEGQERTTEKGDQYYDIIKRYFPLSWYRLWYLPWEA